MVMVLERTVKTSDVCMSIWSTLQEWGIISDKLTPKTSYLYNSICSDVNLYLPIVDEYEQYCFTVSGLEEKSFEKLLNNEDIVNEIVKLQRIISESDDITWDIREKIIELWKKINNMDVFELMNSDVDAMYNDMWNFADVSENIFVPFVLNMMYSNGKEVEIYICIKKNPNYPNDPRKYIISIKVLN